MGEKSLAVKAATITITCQEASESLIDVLTDYFRNPARESLLPARIQIEQGGQWQEFTINE